MNTITLTDEQLELVRREAMAAVVKDLEHAAVELDKLATFSPWPVGVQSSDAQSALRLLHEDLAVLDAVGWPRDATRSEIEQRRQAASGEAS